MSLASDQVPVRIVNRDRAQPPSSGRHRTWSRAGSLQTSPGFGQCGSRLRDVRLSTVSRLVGVDHELREEQVRLPDSERSLLAGVSRTPLGLC